MNHPAAILLLLAAFAAPAIAAPGTATIIRSKHNLSVSGTGALHAAATAGDSSASEMCIFCHTPHVASTKGALWNRYDSAPAYIPYTSSTVKATIGQPTGSSRLCLSCHDGTIALGMVKSRSRAIAFQGTASALPKSRSNLGTDLTDDHPISFKYNSTLAARDGALLAPPRAGDVHLDANGEMQCTTCHDPHNGSNGKFLVVNNNASALCLTCHNPAQWRQSAHATAANRWNGILPNPWPHTDAKSVSANACENCHSPHNAGSRERLLNYQAEEQNCYPCHNGHVAKQDIQSEFNKASVHPLITTTGLHDPAESVLVSSAAARHVECTDCHDAHAASSAGRTTPLAVSGAFTGVRGINAAGANLNQVSFEYELCFRCHGDTAKGPARVRRQFPQLNTRLEFQTGSGRNSFHPVVQTGSNPLVPSLRSPWTTASRMTCGDCHNNDSGSNAGGTGPAGPHGSAFAPLLERPVSYADTASSSANSALCFKCHNFVDTAWRDHVRHIGLTSCLTCHDPHGSPNAHLINFDVTVVSGAKRYDAGNLGHGTCTLTCHGKEHNNTSY